MFDSSSDDEHVGTLGGRNRATGDEMGQQCSRDLLCETSSPMAVVGGGLDQLPKVRLIDSG